MSLDKFAEDLTAHVIDYLLEKSGVNYEVHNDKKNPEALIIRFFENKNLIYEWTTYGSISDGIKESFLQLLGVGLIAAFPDNFQFKGDK